MGCFGPNAFVVDSRRGRIRVSEILPEDFLFSGAFTKEGNHCFVRVSKVVHFPPRLQTLLGHAGITPWHPVSWGDGAWAFPEHVIPYERTQMVTPVYNLVMDVAPGNAQGRVAIYDELGDLEFMACTLAHGLQGDVVDHPYFGTGRVLEDLSTFPGWKEGIVRVPDSFKVVRSSGGEQSVVGMWKE